MTTRREPPEGYQWPGADVIAASKDTVYWLSEQADWTGATPLFMVMMADGDGQHIVAEKCYLKHAMVIVSALRRADG